MAVSVEGRDLVEKLMARDPVKRIDAAKALQHPWFTRRSRSLRQPLQLEEVDQSEPNEYACTIS